MPLTQVQIESENKLGPLPGYLSSGQHKAAVIVIQEAWGVTDQIKGMAERWFGDNYVVLVPDFYRGEVPIDHHRAFFLVNGLDWHGATLDIQGAVNFLKARGIEKIGVAGYCMGGALSIAAAVHVNGIQAAAPFYGSPKAEHGADPTFARVPLSLHFGTEDHAKGFSDPEAQSALEKKLTEGKVQFEFHRYEGAGHGFCNENKPTYNEAACNLARQRVLTFFERHLLQ